MLRLLRLLRAFCGLFAGSGRPVVITFTGGMGAQMISAAIYFSMEKSGKPVYADLSYFQKSEKVALPGVKNEVSHWGWQLSGFGLSLSDFKTCPHWRNTLHWDWIEDGVRKLELGLKALSEPAVAVHFPVPQGVTDVLDFQIANPYLCIHVRRGDYLNVGTSFVTDREFGELAGKFKKLLTHLVILSDSPISQSLMDVMTAQFQEVICLDAMQCDAYAAHRIMRHASVLVCSSSQFSLIAAMLNPDVLTVVPKKWFVEQKRIDRCMNDLSSFQVFNTRKTS